ncbi:MAG: CDP-alcohol phosphatidyltransferase family protein [Planctomycetota bacterium]
MATIERKPKLMKIIPFLPSALTLAGIVCGMTAVLRVANADLDLHDGHAVDLLQQACWLIFGAMVFDVLDGKIARLMDAESVFGRELDSLADVISFGVAPAFVANRFLIALLAANDHDVTRQNFLFLALIAIVFTLCAAMRLARYNVEADGVPHSHLDGLPTPAAAGFVMANILFFVTYVDIGRIGTGSTLAFVIQALFPFTILVTSLLMVSRVRCAHVGHLITERLNRFSALATAVIFIPVVVWKPAEVFFVFMWAYVLWALVPAGVRFARRVSRKRPQLMDDIDDDE